MANVSHDLKTPLTMIKAYAEMARDINYNDKDKRNENLSIIIQEADRLNILVNDILNLSKLENNKEELTLEDYDLVEEVKSILNRYQIIKETENYKLILNAPEIAVVHADKNKINAKDYEELITYLAEEQEKSMKVEESSEEIVDNAEETEDAEETKEEV